jgi:hypothetical protein
MEQPDLEREVRDLARRVAEIEVRLGLAPLTGLSAAAEARPMQLAAAGEGIASGADTTDVMPALGRALLGLAGAYLLRALTEADTLPVRAGVGIGIVYALLWLVWAAHTPASRRIGAALHSLTAVMVLAPLLWEATDRFHAVSTWTSGIILLLFTVFGLGVSWRKNLLIVATIATLAGLGTASALLVATKDVAPFTTVILAIALAVEASACLDHWLGERWLAALAADLAVLLATWLLTNERGLPEAYAPISQGWLLGAQMSLLAIYLASTIIRTLLRHVTFTGFEIAQCAVAFLISVGGGLRISPAMAGLALIFGVACYVVSFAVLERQGRSRNFYTYSTFGILLVLAGSRILLSAATDGAVWAALAVACIWAGGIFRSLTLQVHGCLYLVLGLVVSGAFHAAGEFVLGSGSWPGEHAGALGEGAAAALIGYLLVAHYGRGKTPWNFLAVRLGVAAAFAWLAAGITAGMLAAAYHAGFGEAASHAYCATLRTGVLAAASLLLAWAGTRWHIVEMLHLIYPTMVLGAYRLLVVDLHEERKAALVLSLLIYGTALIALPKLARGRGARSRE